MNPNVMVALGIILTSYLLGSVPFGFIAARQAGVDITTRGSGNTGATNVLRTVGIAHAVTVLLLDVGKGTLAAYLGLRFLNMGTVGALLAGMAAIAGHNWSLFLGFRGGKGVATSAGVILVALPWALAVGIGVFALTVLATRYVSLGSLLGSWAAVAFTFASGNGLEQKIPVLFLASLITYKHRSNIERLLQGNENKITIGRKNRNSEPVPYEPLDRDRPGPESAPSGKGGLAK